MFLVHSLGCNKIAFILQKNTYFAKCLLNCLDIGVQNFTLLIGLCFGDNFITMIKRIKNVGTVVISATVSYMCGVTLLSLLYCAF
jgi:hypothetical protein